MVVILSRDRITIPVTE